MLENLRISDASVGHVTVSGAGAVISRSGAAAAANRFIIPEVIGAKQGVVHRPLAGGG